MSSRSDRLSRLGPVVLFLVILAASTLVYPGLTPLFAVKATSKVLSSAVGRGVTILSRAKRPYEDVTFSEPLKAFIPEFVTLGGGAVTTPEAPKRPVLIGERHGWDFAFVQERAKRDGLAWNEGIGGTEIVAFATDEAHLRAALAKAGVTLAPSELRPFSPLLEKLQSQMKGVVLSSEAWIIPAHSNDGLMLYGPYVDLEPGPYRVKMLAQMQGSPARCRAAAAGFRPSLAVTRDAGGGVLKAAGPASVSVAPTDPCSVSLETAFAVPSGGANRVETLLAGATHLPIQVESYALTAEPAAQSR